MQLKEPEHEIVTLKGSDEEVSNIVSETMKKLYGGGHGKKILFQWAD